MPRLTKAKAHFSLSEISQRLDIAIEDLRIKADRTEDEKEECFYSDQWAALMDFKACVQATLGEGEGGDGRSRVSALDMIEVAKNNNVISGRQAQSLTQEFSQKVSTILGQKVKLTPEQSRELMALAHNPNPVAHLAMK